MANFTYGDSSRTGDDKYVLAQFRSDASLAWVGELRAFLVKDELKYKWFVPERHRVMSNPELWKRVENGVHQAEITIIDPRSYQDFAIAELLEQRAEPGIDFDFKTINEISGQYIIEWSPVGRLGAFNLDWLADNTNFENATDFSAHGLKKRAGGKLRDAVVLAARAHGMISPSELNEILANSFGGGTLDYQTRMKYIGEVTRVFDVEHPKSIPILNEFAQRLAHAAGIPRSLTHAMNHKASVYESASHEVDHIQAADLAAGWAVDLLTLTNGDYRAVAQRFAWVGVNGVVIPG
ncbi:MAG: hypothetical protein WBL50_17990 [Candidatus Acidiferrum sp.]